MDLSSISASRFAEPLAQDVPQAQSPYRSAGSAFNPSGSSPVPGSNWPADKSVWVAESGEVTYLDRAHISEIGRRMMSRMEGQWEIQSHTVRLYLLEENSAMRNALAASFKARSAVESLLALQAGLAGTGTSVDIYA